MLSASGLGAIVLGILQSSSWGLVEPKDSPIAPLGFSLSLWMVVGGALLLYAFVRWQRHREATGQDPLVHLDLLKIPPLLSGLINLLSQNLILMGVFFVIPLYLQLVLGLDALETGIKMLPVSITMFITSVLGSRLSLRYSVRTIIRAGLTIDALAVLVLTASIDPTLSGVVFSAGMALLGVGMGLLASQLGNVVQSSVDASGRSEAGGLQYTAQQLGSSLGVALIGAIVIVGLTGNFLSNIEDDPRISEQIEAGVTVAIDGSVEFVATSDVATALEQSGLDDDTATALVESYESAQIQALKTGLLVAGILALLTLMFTGNLPSKRPEAAEASAGAVAS